MQSFLRLRHDAGMTSDDVIRVGTAERQAAIDLLGEHWRAGRLDPSEHEARTTKAFAAVTRGDLDALFSDLPRGSGPLPWAANAPRDATAAGPSGTIGPYAVPQATPGTAGSGPSQPVPPTAVLPAALPQRRGALATVGAGLSRARDTVMALTPIGATALFVTGHAPWPVFLAIPAAGIVLYGPGGNKTAEQRRRAERDQRRAEREQGRIARDQGRAALPQRAPDGRPGAQD